MPKIEVKGLDKLKKALKEKITLDDVKQVVSKTDKRCNATCNARRTLRGDIRRARQSAALALTCKTAALLPRLGQKRNTALILSMALALWMHSLLLDLLMKSRLKSLKVTCKNL